MSQSIKIESNGFRLSREGGELSKTAKRKSKSPDKK